MRIGIFTNTYKPEINGVVTSVSTFRDELVRQGHAVYIFAPEAASFEDEDYGVFRYPAIKLKAKVNYPLAIPVSPYINWVVPRLKLDILHSQHPILIGEEAIAFARNLNLPHVFTHHTQYEEYSHYIPFNQNIIKTLTREVVRTYLTRCVKIIAPTRSIMEQLRQQYPGVADRFSALPSPIDLARFHPDGLNPQPIRRQYRLDDAFTFVSVARLTVEKRFDVLLKAFVQVVNRYANTRLLIVGDGASRKSLEELARKLHIDRQVIFAGSVPYEQVPSYLAAGDAFAFASTSETQGLVMLEGMAVGLPVVTVDAPGNRDVTVDGYNGLLVQNSDDVAALAEAMARMVADEPLRRSLAEGARQTATGYSAENLTRGLVDLYQQSIDIYHRRPLEYKREFEALRQFPPQWLDEMTGGHTDWLDSLASFWQKLGN